MGLPAPQHAMQHAYGSQVKEEESDFRNSESEDMEDEEEQMTA